MPAVAAVVRDPWTVAEAFISRPFVALGLALVLTVVGAALNRRVLSAITLGVAWALLVTSTYKTVRAEPYAAPVVILVGIALFAAFYWLERATARTSGRSYVPHNLQCVGTQLRTIYFRENGHIGATRAHDGGVGREAIVAVYANRPVKGSHLSTLRGVTATVCPVASIIEQPGGWWLDESSMAVDFAPGAPPRELLLVYRDPDGSVWAVEDRREPVGRKMDPRHFVVFKAGHLMGGLQVLARLSVRGCVVSEIASL